MGDPRDKGGFFLVYRDLVDKIKVTDPPSLFLHLLSDARWQKSPDDNGLRYGQLFMNVTKRAERYGVSRRTLTRWISVLEVDQSIVTAQQRRGIVVTVVNYKEYQNPTLLAGGENVTPDVTPGVTPDVSPGVSPIKETKETKETKKQDPPPPSNSLRESGGYAAAGGDSGLGLHGETDATVATPLDIVAAWNAMCRDHPRIKPVSYLTPSRERKCRERLRDAAWAAHWRRAIDVVDFEREDFAWRPDFNWFVANDTNMWKLIEGVFTNNGRPKHAERLF